MANPVCFVIQPMDERSENVSEWYLAPALSNRFEIKVPGTEPTSSITETIFKHLREDALVVAFLGAPYRLPAMGNNWLWNPNVMLEAGFRMGLRQPILFVREKRAQNDEPLLPFDLFNTSVIELISAEEEKGKVNRDRIVAKIRDAANIIVMPGPAKSSPRSVYAFPSLTLAFGGGSGKITSASDDAAAFLRYPPLKNLVGLEAGEFVKKLTSEMVPSQREAFGEEQDRLFGLIFLGRKPLATVCIVFGRDSLQPGAKVNNAYLPLVTRFRAAQGEATTLEVIYLNVTASAAVDDKGVVRCRLGLETAA